MELILYNKECKAPNDITTTNFSSIAILEPISFYVSYPQGNLSDMAFLLDRAVKWFALNKVSSTLKK